MKDLTRRDMLKTAVAGACLPALPLLGKADSESLAKPAPKYEERVLLSPDELCIGTQVSADDIHWIITMPDELGFELGMLWRHSWIYELGSTEPILVRDHPSTDIAWVSKGWMPKQVLDVQYRRDDPGWQNMIALVDDLIKEKFAVPELTAFRKQLRADAAIADRWSPGKQPAVVYTHEPSQLEKA
jgi:hypothetical protein